MKEILKKYIGIILAGSLSGAGGASIIVYLDGISQALDCIGEIKWQVKD